LIHFYLLWFSSNGKV